MTYIRHQRRINSLIPGKFGPKNEIYSQCYEIWHSEQFKFVNCKYDMISNLQERLFTSILQNSYSENFQSHNKVFKLKTVSSHKKVMLSAFSINATRQAVMEIFLSFQNFKSRKKVTESFFSGHVSFCFHDAQISWNNIFSDSSH